MSDDHHDPLQPGWMLANVGEICDVLGGGTPSTEDQRYWCGNIPWITSADIHGIGDIQPRKCINGQAIRESATNLVPTSSVIVVTRVGLGRVALAPEALCFS